MENNKKTIFTWKITSDSEINGALNWLDTNGEIMLHFNPRSFEKQLVINTFYNGSWGDEIRISYEIPTISAQVVLTKLGFEINFNGLTYFLNRMNYFSDFSLLSSPLPDNMNVVRVPNASWVDDKIVLICATGRSGSTTLLRLINTIPNSNICGENFGSVFCLLDFYTKLKFTFKNHRKEFRTSIKDYQINQKPAWYNSMNYFEIVRMIKEMIVKMFKNNHNTSIWGFKEIRYDSGNIKYLKIFKELFPQTQVLLQIRNIETQRYSGWYKDDGDESVQFLTEYNKDILDFSKQNADWCFLTTFESMLSDRTHIQDIFSFIDCIESYDENKVTEILENNTK